MAKQRQYRIEKGYFRNDQRFGRTTKLMLNSNCVFEGMGICTKRDLVRQYEAAQQGSR